MSLGRGRTVSLLGLTTLLLCAPRPVSAQYTPVSPIAPTDPKQCSDLRAAWDALQQQKSAQHQACLDANAKAPANPQGSCSRAACQSLHDEAFGDRIRKWADYEVDYCNRQVDVYQKRKALVDEQKNREEAQREQRNDAIRQAYQQKVDALNQQAKEASQKAEAARAAHEQWLKQLQQEATAVQQRNAAFTANAAAVARGIDSSSKTTGLEFEVDADDRKVGVDMPLDAPLDALSLYVKYRTGLDPHLTTAANCVFGDLAECIMAAGSDVAADKAVAPVLKSLFGVEGESIMIDGVAGGIVAGTSILLTSRMTEDDMRRARKEDIPPDDFRQFASGSPQREADLAAAWQFASQHADWSSLDQRVFVRRFMAVAERERQKRFYQLVPPGTFRTGPPPGWNPSVDPNQATIQADPGQP